MASAIIQLVGTPNQRNVNASASLTKDQRFISATFSKIENPGTGKTTIYVEKRPGIKARTTIISGLKGVAVKTLSTSSQIFAFFDSAAQLSYLYSGTGTLYGTADTPDVIGHLTEISRSGTQYVMVAPLNAGINAGAYYLSYDTAVLSGSAAFTADTTNANANLTNASSTSGLLVGQNVSGTGIPAATRISAINGTTVTMSNNATATGTGITVTRERMAKIMSANFPVRPSGPFVDLDGYLFIADRLNGRIHQSNLNSVPLWNAVDFVTPDPAGGTLHGVTKLKSTVYAMMAVGVELFFNGGQPSGSVLSRVKQSFSQIGVISPIAFCDIENKIYQIDQHGGVYVRVVDETKKISNTSVERVVQSSGAGNLCAVYWAGKPVLVLANKFTSAAAPDYSYFFDIETNLWSESGLGLTVRLDSLYQSNIVYGVAYDTTGKDLYYDFITPTYQDNAASYTMSIQTSRITFGTERRKFVSSVRLNADVQTSGTCTLEVSDDDYVSWVTLGTFDMTSMNKRITRCGSYKGGRSYRLTHSANTAFRAESLEIDYEVGQA